jgi:uncharacterized protein (DUF302 family)
MGKNNFFFIVFFLMVSAPPFGYAVQPEKMGTAWVYSSESDYESAKTFLIDAIKGRGLVINNIGNAEAMLGRTAGAVGVNISVYKHADVVLFCKADLAHNLVVMSPHNIVLCPYSIAVYETQEKPGTVYYSYSVPQLNLPTEKLIRRLLHDIVLEAMD